VLPLKDLNRSLTTPHVNRLIIVTNVIVFTVYFLASVNVFLDQSFAESMIGNSSPGLFVMYPIDIVNGQRLYTLFTSMFMHASWLHLLGNMLFLWVFGDNIEDIFGHVGYVLFYLFSGLAAAFTHILSVLYAPALSNLLGVPMTSDLYVGVVGASGAISGVLGAYLVLFPKAKVIALVFYLILPVPAVIFLGGWFLLQLIYVFLDLSGGVAYFAHIGGFVVGMVLASLIGLRRKKAREIKSRI
jgi:membrane associated rhomboid family serine protease